MRAEQGPLYWRTVKIDPDEFKCPHKLPADEYRRPLTPEGQPAPRGLVLECTICRRRWIVRPPVRVERGMQAVDDRWVEQRRTLFRKRWVDAE
jgi:hypothetical protein